MSGYLWGIAQLVNDPSNDLVNALRKRLLGQPQISENVTNFTENEHLRTKELQEGRSAPESSGRKVGESTKFKSKSIQVGQPPMKYRTVAVQTNTYAYLCVNKTTSVQHDIRLPLLNRGISTLPSANKDTYTETTKNKMCKEHRKVISMLENWSNHKHLDSTDSLVRRMKNKIMDLINLLKIEKIQNIPEYHCPEKEIIKLYREASCNYLDIHKI
ncbi:jg11782 [Pararge aegeria aegeria]|uniref:Jg11782 protein n=1 Tax=Pararge aegeria aegeria TaxID=348720 RepID=A0A8S4S402_9NEOP|nr:jg11782 [Pararge aegeria aegeria]